MRPVPGSNRPWRLTLALATGVALATTVAACGSTGGGSGATQASAVTEAKAVVAKYLKEPTSINQAVVLKAKPPAGKKIIYLQQGSVPSIVAIGDAIQQASKALNWTMSRINYDPSDPASLQSAFQSALVQKPDAVMVTGLAPDLYGKSVIAQYKKAGVPIIVGAAGPVQNTDTILGTAASLANSANAAKVLADWFIANSNGKGHAVWVQIPSFTTLAAEERAFFAEIDAKCPGCSVSKLNVTLTQVGAGSVPGAVSSQLQNDPAAKYVLFDDGDWAGGINAGLKAAGISGIKIAGVTATPEQFTALNAGTQSAWTGYNFAYNGYGLVDIALRHFEGQPITSNDEIMPTQILTPANVSGATAFLKPSDALAQFEKVWNVS